MPTPPRRWLPLGIIRRQLPYDEGGGIWGAVFLAVVFGVPAIVAWIVILRMK